CSAASAPARPPRNDAIGASVTGAVDASMISFMRERRGNLAASSQAEVHMQARLLVFAASMVFSGAALADDDDQGGGCGIPSNVVAGVQGKLATVVTLNNGAIFGQFLSGPNRMWSAVVDRQGVLCSLIKIGDAWPGRRAI